MAIKLDGCRLCVEELGSPICPLDDPNLQQQMKSVFYFPIEPKQGFSSRVCSACIFVIGEFYKFSEKVRQNQDSFSIAISANVESSTNMVSQIKLEPLDPLAEDMDQSLEPKQGVITDNDIQSDKDDVDIKFEPLLDLEIIKLDHPLEPDEIMVTDKDNCSDVPILDNVQDPLSNHEKSASQQPKSKTEEQILQEENTLNDFFPMICELCGHKESSFNFLLRHFKEIHRQPGYVVCCEEKLYQKSKLKLHMQNHVKPNGELCEICNKHVKNITKHRRIMHPKEEKKKFKCDQCPNAYVNKCLLISHMNKHLPKTHQNIPCPQCDMKLASKKSLRTHISNMHSVNRTPMICDFCGKQFLNKPHFERHVNKHKGIEYKRRVLQKKQCHICKRILFAEQALRKHLQVVHCEPAETLECDECHRKYPNSSTLNSHKERVHIRAKFGCEFCDKRFKFNFRLQDHRATHLRDRLWKCEYCDKALNTKHTLQSHVKRSHPAEYAEQKRLATEKAFGKN
ncbi:PR domain zinc finger protein 5-like [Uranotaenia lowii]|uniref:PR domain zinc finger protein 5-like n=1 Tax=Uranotaenia lowii TaxID=190385 RepID=UPI002478DE2B|nr:PR domain zinc finger protein 5-like [Uranotaenia lowii]XP_055609982.1 PR domain zinc finger protein 5-like [Uranotaenia lowii]